MALTDEERLVVRLEARIRDFERNFQKAKRTANDNFRSIERRANQSATRLQAAFTKASHGVTAAFRGIGPALGIGGALGVAGATQAIRSVISEAAGLAQVADKLGVGVETLQELRFAAEQAGIAQNTLDMALQRFTRRAAEAARGTGEAKDALAQLGISVTDANGRLRPAEELLRDVADGLARVQSPAERVRLAFKLFDSEGVAMVNMLRGGSAALDNMRQQARDAGAVLNEDLVRSAERVNERFAKLTQTIGTKFKEAILAAVDGVDTFLERFREIDERTMVAPLQRQLDALAMESRALKKSMQTHEEILAFDPSDSAALQALEAHRNRLSAIEAEYTAIMQRIAEIKDEAKPVAASGGVDLGEIPPISTKPPKGESPAEKLRRITDAMQRRTEMLQVEAATLGKSTFEIERRRVALELEHAVQAAGIPITDEVRQQISDLSVSYARAADTVAAATKAEEEHNERLRQKEMVAQDAARAVSNFAGTLIRDFGSAEDAALQLLNRLIDIVLQLTVLKPLENALAGAMQGSGLFGSLFGGGTSGTPMNILPKGYASGGITNRPAIFGEGRLPEAAVPLPDGRRIPVDLRMPQMPAAARAPGRSVVEVRLSDGLEASILERAGEQSVEITRSGINRFDRDVLPNRVNQIRARPRAR